MVKYTREMAEYEKVCATFRAAGITFNEIGVDGYKVTFELSKDDFKSKVIIDCASDLVEQQTLNAITSFERFVEWDKDRKK